MSNEIAGIGSKVEFAAPSGMKGVKNSPPFVVEMSASEAVRKASADAIELIKKKELTVEEQRALMEESIDNWSRHVNPGFLQYRKSVASDRDFAAIEWIDGEPGGSTVISASGVEYIDCLGGFGCYNVGHRHPEVVAAVQAQLSKQPLHSQELLDPLRGIAAKLLSMTMPPPNSGKEEDRLQYSFMTNSGAESVEACLKMAMLTTGRQSFIGVIGSFHGKTLGALACTSKAAFRGPFAHSLLRFTHIPVNDVTALRAAFTSAAFTGTLPAGLIIEPVLGEGGIYVCSPEFLRAARELCDEHGTMLIFDEVQSGMGRTGKWWACEWAGVAPDLMAVGKAFGGGVVGAGACVGSAKSWAKYMENPFLHTTTFGGNPMSMAGAIATMHVLADEEAGLIPGAYQKGEWLMARLRELQAAHPTIIKEVRGRGLMVGLEFPDDATGYSFSKGVFKRQVLLSGTLVNARTLRVEPPLTIRQEQLEEVLRRMQETLCEIEAERAAAASEAATAPVAAGGGGTAATRTTVRPSVHVRPLPTADPASVRRGQRIPSVSSEESDASAVSNSTPAGNETDPDSPVASRAPSRGPVRSDSLESDA